MHFSPIGNQLLPLQRTKEKPLKDLLLQEPELRFLQGIYQDHQCKV